MTPPTTGSIRFLTVDPSLPDLLSIIISGSLVNTAHHGADIYFVKGSDSYAPGMYIKTFEDVSPECSVNHNSNGQMVISFDRGSFNLNEWPDAGAAVHAIGISTFEDDQPVIHIKETLLSNLKAWNSFGAVASSEESVVEESVVEESVVEESVVEESVVEECVMDKWVKTDTTPCMSIRAIPFTYDTINDKVMARLEILNATRTSLTYGVRTDADGFHIMVGDKKDIADQGYGRAYKFASNGKTLFRIIFTVNGMDKDSLIAKYNKSHALSWVSKTTGMHGVLESINNKCNVFHFECSDNMHTVNELVNHIDFNPRSKSDESSNQDDLAIKLCDPDIASIERIQDVVGDSMDLCAIMDGLKAGSFYDYKGTILVELSSHK